MRLYTIETAGNEKVALQGNHGEMYLLEQFGIEAKDMNELISGWDVFEAILKNKMTMTNKEADSNASATDDYKILAPLPVPLQDIVCLGVNYHDHREETADVIDCTKKTDTVYFSKRVNCCNHPMGQIPNYDFVDSLDYEVELGVILKKDAFQVKAADAADYILGYTIINDISARNVQLKHQQWYLGKSLDGYTAMGPCIVTADEIKDAHDLDIACFVNGEKRQSSNTKYMITSIEEAIEELTQGMTLKAGTIIATGTPGGVGMGMNPPSYLKSGDHVRCEIAKIGSLENTVQ